MLLILELEDFVVTSDVSQLFQDPLNVQVHTHQKLLQTILRGTSDANIRFDDLHDLLLHLGFEERVKGSHHIFRKTGIEDRPNLQRDGNKAKPYQVRQVRSLILKYRLGEEE